MKTREESMMKIAAITDDGKTISAHFGRATQYAVFTIENGNVQVRELRDKPGHREFESHGAHQGHHDDHGHGFGADAEEKHRRMFAAIADCQVMLARGMGRGAYEGLRRMGIRPIVTAITGIESAVRAVIDGTIVEHDERLH